MMSYIIQLSPEFGITPQEFVRAWNEHPECPKIAKANMHLLPQEYWPLFLNQEQLTLPILPILKNVAGGATPRMISEWVKEVVMREGVTHETEIIYAPQPDGMEYMIVQNKSHAAI